MKIKEFLDTIQLVVKQTKSNKIKPSTAKVTKKPVKSTTKKSVAKPAVKSNRGIAKVGIKIVKTQNDKLRKIQDTKFNEHLNEINDYGWGGGDHDEEVAIYKKKFGSMDIDYADVEISGSDDEEVDLSDKIQKFVRNDHTEDAIDKIIRDYSGIEPSAKN